jgi:hypothetical protein
MYNKQSNSQEALKIDHLNIKKEEISFDFLKQLVYENPNDFMLGEKVRNMIYNLEKQK